jgi:hypothetical protein
MKVACSLFLSASLICLAFAQTPAQEPAQPQQQSKDQPLAQSEPQAPKQPLAFGLEDSTPVKMRITRNLSSADATTGERVDFEVLEDIAVKGVIVIPRGGLALGTVTDAQPKRRMGRGGKLDVNIDDVRLVDGEKIPLRAVKEAKGGSHTGAMTGAIVATAIVFFPAAPLFLLMHGKDITIPKGTEITAYINGDIPLDPAKFQPQSVPTVATAQNANGEDAILTSVEVKSTPDGADITADDKYVGSTPSTLKLIPGDHKIKVEKSGFKPWEKTLTVSVGGTITLNPTLDKE